MFTAPDSIWQLWHRGGLYARAHECFDKRWDNRGKSSPDRCIAREKYCAICASSLLVTDLPLKTFVYHYPFINNEFSAGWLLDPSAIKWHAAFAHDAASGSNYQTRQPCVKHMNAQSYVNGRLMTSKNCTATPNFLKSAFNCYVHNISLMREMHQLYETKKPPTCNTSYNQVHISYSEADIVGVFYKHPSSKQYAIQASKSMGGLPIVFIGTNRSNSSTRPCLQNLTHSDVKTYFARLEYTHTLPLDDLDVLWIDLFPRSVQDCLTDWVGHRNIRYYSPPIGGKVKYPLVWNYRDELSCAAMPSSHGGLRKPPHSLPNRTYEVVRYNINDGLESKFKWFYHAHGSACWYHSGRTMAFHDHKDLLLFTNTSSLSKAMCTMNRTCDTLVFTHHVDAGYKNQKRCTTPQSGWNVVYFFQHEIVSLQSPQVRCAKGREHVRTVHDGRNIHAIRHVTG